MVKVMKKMDETGAAMTPARIGRIRQFIADVLEEQLEQAHRAIMGEEDENGKVVKWDQTQARLFNIFINKALPDLKHSHISRDEGVPISKLTREQLEALVAQKALEDARDITPATDPTDPTDEDEQ